MSKHKPRRRLTQVFAVMASERSTWPVPNAIFGTALNLPNLHFTRLSYRELNIRELASLRFATRRTGGDARFAKKQHHRKNARLRRKHLKRHPQLKSRRVLHGR